MNNRRHSITQEIPRFFRSSVTGTMNKNQFFYTSLGKSCLLTDTCMLYLNNTIFVTILYPDTLNFLMKKMKFKSSSVF